MPQKNQIVLNHIRHLPWGMRLRLLALHARRALGYAPRRAEPDRRALVDRIARYQSMKDIYADWGFLKTFKPNDIRSALIDGATFFHEGLFEYLLSYDPTEAREMALNAGLPEEGVEWLARRACREMTDLQIPERDRLLDADTLARLLQARRTPFSGPVTEAVLLFIAQTHPRQWTALHSTLVDLLNTPTAIVDALSPNESTHGGILHQQVRLLEHPNGGARLWPRFYVAYRALQHRGPAPETEEALLRHAPATHVRAFWFSLFDHNPAGALALLSCRPDLGDLGLSPEALQPYLSSPDEATRLGAFMALQSIQESPQGAEESIAPVVAAASQDRGGQVTARPGATRRHR